MDKKEFTKDMKQINTAPTKEAARAALKEFKKNGNLNTFTLLGHRENLKTRSKYKKLEP